MDRPRTGGRPPSAGRAAGRGSLGSICAGGSTHPGAGVPMAALVGPARRRCLLRDRASTSRSMPNGYAWWYVDAFSDDGALRADDHRLHRQRVLALLHSSAARRGDPDNHCAINVALYGPRRRALGDDRARPRAVSSRRRSFRGRAERARLGWRLPGDRHRRAVRAAALQGARHGARRRRT